jgi:tRNA pseudouridine55 synthase
LGNSLKPPRRPVSGVLLFDKAKGYSSNQALQQVKRLFRAEKTGHTGTLDPLASGLLPLMFGEATKFASDLIAADKTYEATVHLGFSSTTGDAEGEITASGAGARNVFEITQDEVQCVLQSFLGETQQIPPMFSALKKDGKPLYEYARQGVEIQREARQIVTHRLELLSWKNDSEGVFLTFEATCSKGTYIRTLAEDIARALGTVGYLTDLRRTKIGVLSTQEAVTLERLSDLADDFSALDAELKPVDGLLTGLKPIVLNNEFARRFLHGQRLPLDAVNAESGRVRVYGEGSECNQSNDLQGRHACFLGTGILETNGKNALLRPDRLLQVKNL